MAAVAASSRGRFGFGWFLLAVIISPLIALLLVLVLPNKREARQRSAEYAAVIRGSKKCPMCAELVRKEARLDQFPQFKVTARPNGTIIVEPWSSWLPL